MENAKKINDSENGDNNLLGDYMASQIFHHLSDNVMDKYINILTKSEMRDEISS